MDEKERHDLERHVAAYSNSSVREMILASSMARESPFLGEWSLALIGNASGQSFGVEQNLDPRRFRQETRSKPLAFAADEVSYGI